MTLLRRLDGFLVGILAAVGLAWLLPARGSASGAVSLAAQLSVSLLFFLYGARLPLSEAWAGLRNWRLHGVVLLTTFALFPLLGWGLQVLRPSVLTPSLYAGVLFLCLLPSTVQTSIAFTSLARGNVAASICAASLSNVVGVLATPLLVGWLLTDGARVTASSMVRILGELLAPFVVGQLCRRWIGGALARHPKRVSVVDRGTVLLVVYSAFSAGVTDGVWHQVTLPRLLVVVVIDAVLLGFVLLLSGFIGRRLGFSRADRIVVTFCGSKKSIAAGIPMATALFPHATVGLIVLPAMLYHQLQLLVGALLARRWGRQAEEAGPQAVTDETPVAELAAAG